MSNIQQRKVAKLAVTFMVTALGTMGCSTPEPHKIVGGSSKLGRCHVHATDNNRSTFKGKHCHKNNGLAHKHPVLIGNPPRRPPPPRVSVNPAPPPVPPAPPVPPPPPVSVK